MHVVRGVDVEETDAEGFESGLCAVEILAKPPEHSDLDLPSGARIDGVHRKLPDLFDEDGPREGRYGGLGPLGGDAKQGSVPNPVLHDGRHLDDVLVPGHELRLEGDSSRLLREGGDDAERPEPGRPVRRPTELEGRETRFGQSERHWPRRSRPLRMERARQVQSGAGLLRIDLPQEPYDGALSRPHAEKGRREPARARSPAPLQAAARAIRLQGSPARESRAARSGSISSFQSRRSPRRCRTTAVRNNRAMAESTSRKIDGKLAGDGGARTT